MVLLTVDGDQVPVIPLGEVVFNVGAVLPEQIVSGVVKFAVTLLTIVTFITSVIVAPHIFVAVKVNAIVPVAEALMV